MQVELVTKKGQRVPITKTVIIGRDPSCDIRTKSQSCSRKHVAIFHKEGLAFAKDLHSRNGTFVNDEQLEPGAVRELFDFDELRLGGLRFQLSVIDEDTDLPHLRGFDASHTGLAEFDTAQAGHTEDPRETIPPEDLKDLNPEGDSVSIEPSTDLKPSKQSTKSDQDTEDAASSENEDEKVEKNKGPQKLPEHLRRKADNSRDAANDALSNFFRGH